MKSFMYRYGNFCPSKKETVVKEHRNRDDPSVRPFKTKTKTKTNKKSKQTKRQEVRVRPDLMQIRSVS